MTKPHDHHKNGRCQIWIDRVDRELLDLIAAHDNRTRRQTITQIVDEAMQTRPDLSRHPKD